VITVAVVSWNTRELLDRCLRSLADQDEVWVIDNASSDGSAELVRERHPGARLIPATGNLGYGPAVNRVAERTGGDWLLACNADVEFRPGAVAALLAAGERSPRAGVLAPRLLLPDGSTQHSVHAFPSVRNTALFNSGLWRLVPGGGERLCLHGAWDPERAREVDWAHGAALLLRRRAFPGFDEAQWMYAEDLDICWRMQRAGWTVRYEPAAEVLHSVSAATAQAWGDEREQRAQASAYAWMLRRRGALRTRTCAALSVGGALARSLRPSRRAVELGYARMHLSGLWPRTRLEGHR
jgi:GT2 family glycosyltransferase